MSREAEVGITAREQEVLGLLSDGLANKEIADELGCSVRTVEFHISNLLRKVGVSSRLELVTRGSSVVPIGAPVSISEAPLFEIRIFSGVAVALLGDTLISLWSAGASPERWAWKCALLDERVAAHEAGVLCMALVLKTSTPPDAGVRAQMKSDFRRFGTKLRRFVGVPLGDSIWMAIVRTIARTVLFVSGRSSGQMVAKSVDEGLERLLEAAGPSTPTRGELEAAVAELSRLLGVTSPSPAKKAG
ncbi:MAG TPA: helix-turn-helix transcriptional regulator [Polyangiaceae bacterium]